MAGSLSYWGTPKVNEIARQYNLLDAPSARKVHQKPIARLGGVAIALSAILSVILIELLIHYLPEPVAQLGLNGLQTQIILLGSLGFFGIGFADDLLTLSATKRLAMQFCVASVVWVAGIRVDCSQLPQIGNIDLSVLSLPVTLLWIVGVVNAMNWIDGLDGLAAGIASIACIPLLTVAMLSQQCHLALWPAALLGGLLGFLIFNFNPAQIFMGDGGSYFIGFMLASVSICCIPETEVNNNILPCLLALAIPLFDMTWVVLGRLWVGRSPFRADQRHLHHQLLAIGLSHKQSVLLIYGLSSVYSALSILSFLLIHDAFWLLNLTGVAIASLITFWNLMSLLKRHPKLIFLTPQLHSKSIINNTISCAPSNPQPPLSI